MHFNMNTTQNITTKERFYLEDALHMENLAWTKYNVYAEQCEDKEIKNILFTISKNKRQHAEDLKQILASSTASGNSYQ